MSTATENTVDVPEVDAPEFVENMKDVTCESMPPFRGATSFGARFDWRCKVACDDDDSEESRRYRHARVTVVMVHKSQLKEYQDQGYYTIPGFCKVHDCGDGEHCAVSYLTFDGLSEDADENQPDPETRAMIKPWRTALVEWLEARPELGAIDVTTCVSGVTYIRCNLRDSEGDQIRFDISRDSC